MQSSQAFIYFTVFLFIKYNRSLFQRIRVQDNLYNQSIILMLLFGKKRSIQVNISYREFGWLKNYIQHKFVHNRITIQLQIGLEIALFSKSSLSKLLSDSNDNMLILLYIYIYIYGLVSLFNGISTYVGYLMPKPFS